MSEFKVISYNVDCLPATLDLNDLPWYLKPITWIYKLIKKTTIVTVNPDSPGESRAVNEAAKLYTNNYDIIALQEDFNYHNNFVITLLEHFSNNHLGGIDLSKFLKLMHLYWLRLPSLRINGLSIFFKNNRFKLIEDENIKWDKSYGYIDHANDALVDKGFKYCHALLDDTYYLDVYTIHMDADFYDPTTCPDISKDLEARASQIKQLAEFIKEHNNNCPVIVLGDTNSTYSRDWDVENLNNNWFNQFTEDYEIKDVRKETGEQGVEDIDKIFYINNINNEHKLVPIECYRDDNYSGLSDHNPIYGKFEIV